MMATPPVSLLDWRARLIAAFLFVGTTLLVVNQRIGFTDSGGFNFLALALRSDVWFSMAIMVGLLLAPKMTILPQGRKGIARTVLLRIPIFFLLTISLASAISSVRYDKEFDLFGALDVLKTVLCIAIGTLVFNLSKASPSFSSILIRLMIYSSALNVAAAIFTSVTSINNIDGFNSETTGDVEVGLGFISYGNRFQGLGTNPNMVMTQGIIALSFLIPEILRRLDINGWWKASHLLLYSISLFAIIMWTGVRAALILLPMTCFLAVWLRTKPGSKSHARALLVVAKMAIIFLVSWWLATLLGLTETLLERVSGSEDGRLPLWIHYSGLLLQNPFGLGVAFESIADTYSIIDRQRLPPHNSILQTGMYGGFVAILLLFSLLRMVIRLVNRLRRGSGLLGLSVELQGTYIAWCAVVVNSMFGGLWSTDLNFAILTGLLMEMTSRFTPIRGPVSPLPNHGAMHPAAMVTPYGGIGSH
jgi:hypothetical protein